MTSKQKYIDLTQRIAESESFGKSETYKNLLKFLVQSTLEGEIPKETTIALEIFGKNDSKEDTGKVRVYIYNLRKKLQKYYNETGKEEEIILTIPKGGYQVKFTKRLQKSQRPSRIPKKYIIAIGAALFLIVFFYANKERKHNAPAFWNSFFHSDRPTIFVLGDLFIYAERDTSLELTRTIRDPDINSNEEYRRFKDSLNDPERPLSELTYSFLIRSSSTWVKSMTELFHFNGSDFNIRFMSQLDSKDLQDHNIIYAGMIKNAGFFKNYFNNSRFSYDADREEIVYVDKIEKDTSYYGPSGDPDNYHSDYGLVAKFPGPNNNTIFLLTGIWDTGASQSVKNFTNDRLLKRFEEKLVEKFGYIPKYFELLFEVNGMDRMELNTKLIYSHEIKDGSHMWDVR